MLKPNWVYQSQVSLLYFFFNFSQLKTDRLKQFEENNHKSSVKLAIKVSPHIVIWRTNSQIGSWKRIYGGVRSAETFSICFWVRLENILAIDNIYDGVRLVYIRQIKHVYVRHRTCLMLWSVCVISILRSPTVAIFSVYLIFFFLDKCSTLEGTVFLCILLFSSLAVSRRACPDYLIKRLHRYIIPLLDIYNSFIRLDLNHSPLYHHVHHVLRDIIHM